MKILIIFVLVIITTYILIIVFDKLIYHKASVDLNACLENYTQATQENIKNLVSKKITNEQSCLVQMEIAQNLKKCDTDVAHQDGFPEFLVNVFTFNAESKVIAKVNNSCKQYPTVN